MKLNCELTKYPSIFRNTYWGNAEQDSAYHNCELYENHNAFVERYQIKSYVESGLPKKKERIIEDYFPKTSLKGFFDHFETFLTTSNKIVCIASPHYQQDFPEFKNFLAEYGFEIFQPLYTSSCTTFVIELSERFVTYKNNKIDRLHKTMDVLSHFPSTNPNIRDNDYECPLHVAIETNQVDIVQKLLNHPQINVNLKNWHHETPLFRAISNYQIDIVAMLLEHKNIKLNKTYSYNRKLLPLCYEYDSMECFKLLLQHPRIDPNLDGYTYACGTPYNMLRLSIENHSYVATELLLQHPRINLNVRDENNDTELHQCIRVKNTFALNLLLNHPRIDVDAENDNGHDVVLHCLEYGERIEELSHLLQHPRININKKSPQGYPLLHIIIEETRYNKYAYLEKKKYIDIFYIMLENPSFDINVRDCNNHTALDYACLHGISDWVQRLLSHSSLEDAQRTYDAFHCPKESFQQWNKNILENFIREKKRTTLLD